MKAPYFIDFARNVIVVTRKFCNAASQMDTDEYKTMMKPTKTNRSNCKTI